MSLRIKGTTLFQFSCCAGGCQTGLLKDRKKRFSGWELCVSLWSGDRRTYTQRAAFLHSNSSSVLDKVSIMICKVLLGGGVLWQGEFIATHQFFFSSCCLARSCSPLSLDSTHCFIHLSASETSGSGLKLFDGFFFHFWFAVFFPSLLIAQWGQQRNNWRQVFSSSAQWLISLIYTARSWFRRRY